MESFSRIFGWGATVGFICFAIGFFGPLVWAPDANQGPLLGIFITGPIGFGLGLGIGIYKELAAKAGGPPSVTPASPPTARAHPPTATRPAPTAAEILAHPTARVLLGIVSAVLLLQGAGALARESGRGPAAAIALGIVAGFVAATGRTPSWFRR